MKINDWPFRNQVVIYKKHNIAFYPNDQHEIHSTDWHDYVGRNAYLVVSSFNTESLEQVSKNQTKLPTWNEENFKNCRHSSLFMLTYRVTGGSKSLQRMFISPLSLGR
jgi:hypothetical protein